MQEPDQDEHERLEPPPDGASCNVHDERGAIVLCPDCRRPICFSCWHAAVRRCHACLTRDPEAAGPRIPWEDHERNIVVRFFDTLASALTPDHSTPGMLRHGLDRALTFFVLTWLPLALVSGVIPYTVTMFFAGGGVHWLGQPTRDEVSLDVLRASGVGFALHLALLVALAVPYRSLTMAYGERMIPSVPLRVVLYRAWLIPFGMLLEGALATLVSTDSMATSQLIVVCSVLPLAIMFSALRAGARMGGGIGPIAAFVVATVPFATMGAAFMLAQVAIAAVLPPISDEAQRQVLEELAPTPTAAPPEPTFRVSPTDA